ncbi:hypothetical protein NDU88_007705 [Pleurodeles waltl]|uniref:Uncharacterized protein n=1 Tax=Pleurodeles waltl TaxID=8319 RepID=A0AAV7VT65_PLEWA|nr:hypothetical protein NDU88_007705 [Pleurodeles waltl]
MTPDFWLLGTLKSEDGLERGSEEPDAADKDTEEPTEAESGNREETEKRPGTTGVSRDAEHTEDQERSEDTLRSRHVPGGAWLTKIRNFLSTFLKQGLCVGKIKLMEVGGQPTSCGIKNLYPLLLNSAQDDMALLVKKWEGRLGAKELEVCDSIEMAQTVLLSAGPQAQYHMVLYNLYYTPAKIASWGKIVGTTCPRCGSSKADLCHMFF